MNLPPLPIVDGWLFIDNSTIEVLTQCPRAFEYSFLHNKVSSGERGALNFGTGMHSALENFYKTSALKESEVSPYQAGMTALTNHFTDHPQGEDEWRSLDLATKMFDFYSNKYLSEGFEICVLEDGKPCVELSFPTPLLDDKGNVKMFSYTVNGETHILRVMYTGKIDLVVKKDNQIFTLDHKTAFQLGQTFWQEQQMSAQHVGYCDSIDKLLKVETSGYIVNALRTRKLGGKTNPVPYDEDFQRETFYITKERKNEWRRNLAQIIQGMLDHYSKDYLPMHTKSCISKYGPCQFFDVCSLPNPVDRKAIIESGLYRDNEWSPLKQITPKTKNANL